MIARLFSLLLSLITAFSVSLDCIATQIAPGGYLMLVNREYRLPESYVPDDLVYPDVRHSGSAYQMRAPAAAALEEMFAAAKQEGITLYAHSGYRSYGSQKAIYERKIRTVKSLSKARLLVADPGASEHQLGLAMDIKNKPDALLNAAFGKTREGIWLAENAWRFGFIIRYKEEWTDITTYAYEPWHVRYVGKEHAAILQEMDTPLELYVQMLRSLAADKLTEGDSP